LGNPHSGVAQHSRNDHRIVGTEPAEHLHISLLRQPERSQCGSGMFPVWPIGDNAMFGRSQDWPPKTLISCVQATLESRKALLK
jgi:hypothetical protein